jgi:hypothetical protein
MVSVSSSRAKVSGGDLAKFATFYSSPPKAYEERADFVAPTGVAGGDFALFVYHYANGGHHYEPPAMLVGEDQSVVAGKAIFDLSSGPPLDGCRTLRASVSLQSLPAYQTILLAFRCNNSRLEFVSWDEVSNYGGETLSAQATVGLDRVLAIGLIGNKSIGAPCDVGVATFKVLGPDSLVLDDEDFVPVISDILLFSGIEGPMSASREYAARVLLTNSLGQNFPNPFNPETTIIYSIKDVSPVSLAIYDVAGRLVRRLVNQKTLSPGSYKVLWDGRNAGGSQVASGVYFCKLVAGPFEATKKMIMLK